MTSSGVTNALKSKCGAAWRRIEPILEDLTKIGQADFVVHQGQEPNGGLTWDVAFSVEKLGTYLVNMPSSFIGFQTLVEGYISKKDSLDVIIGLKRQGSLWQDPTLQGQLGLMREAFTSMPFNMFTHDSSSMLGHRSVDKVENTVSLYLGWVRLAELVEHPTLECFAQGEWLMGWLLHQLEKKLSFADMHAHLLAASKVLDLLSSVYEDTAPWQVEVLGCNITTLKSWAAMWSNKQGKHNFSVIGRRASAASNDGASSSAVAQESAPHLSWDMSALDELSVQGKEWVSNAPGACHDSYLLGGEPIFPKMFSLAADHDSLGVVALDMMMEAHDHFCKATLDAVCDSGLNPFTAERLRQGAFLVTGWGYLPPRRVEPLVKAVVVADESHAHGDCCFWVPQHDSVCIMSNGGKRASVSKLGKKKAVSLAYPRVYVPAYSLGGRLLEIYLKVGRPSLQPSCNEFLVSKRGKALRQGMWRDEWRASLEAAVTSMPWDERKTALAMKVLPRTQIALRHLYGVHICQVPTIDMEHYSNIMDTSKEVLTGTYSTYEVADLLPSEFEMSIKQLKEGGLL